MATKTRKNSLTGLSNAAHLQTVWSCSYRQPTKGRNFQAVITLVNGYVPVWKLILTAACKHELIHTQTQQKRQQWIHTELSKRRTDVSIFFLMCFNSTSTHFLNFLRNVLVYWARKQFCSYDWLYKQFHTIITVKFPCASVQG